MVYGSQAKRHALHVASALGFGATASVIAFNRLAKAATAVLVELFVLTTTNYFDNFPCVTVEDDCASARRTFVAVMDLLGWQLKDVDEVSFEPRLETLGVSFDFERAMESRQFNADN